MRLRRAPGERFRGLPGSGDVPQYAGVPDGTGGSALRMA